MTPAEAPAKPAPRKTKPKPEPGPVVAPVVEEEKPTIVATPPAPGTEEWMRLVTASKVAAITGNSPWQSPFSLWHRMKGNIGDRGGNEGAKERGQFLEQGVLDWWAFKHPEYTEIVPQHYAMLGEWAAATLDA